MPSTCTATATAGWRRLQGREFDAVIDTSGYYPRLVADSARLLAPSCGHYTFVSSVSVYDQNGGAGSEVDGPVGTIEDATIEEITETSYGPLKALCEQAAEHEFGDRTLVVRPGLIVGPDDPTDRFTYWPARIAEGGTVLAPGDPGARTQVIDVRDLAGWMVAMAERGAHGRFNAVGPAQPLTIGALLDRCNAVSGAGADIVWADNQALLDREVEPWTDLPLWLGGDPETEWMDCVDPGPAMAAGLHVPSDRRDDRRHAGLAPCQPRRAGTGRASACRASARPSCWRSWPERSRRRAVSRRRGAARAAARSGRSR